MQVVIKTGALKYFAHVSIFILLKEKTNVSKKIDKFNKPNKGKIKILYEFRQILQNSDTMASSPLDQKGN